MAVTGRLVVCPTPIGNLEDVTLRVLSALRIAREAGLAGPRASAALIAADDVAVARFLDGTLDFPGIPRLLEAAVERFGHGADDLDVDGLVALETEVKATFATGFPGSAR